MPLRGATGLPSASFSIVLCRACSGQLDCIAARRAEVGAAPFLLTPQLVAWVGNAPCGDDAFKRGEELPMIGKGQDCNRWLVGQR